MPIKGGVAMPKLILGSLILMLCLVVGDVSSFGETAPAPRGELRIVDKNPQNWTRVTDNVFEHLIEYDPDGTMVPRLATQWRWLDDRTLEVRLRQGVTFHNGEVFDAEIVQLNWHENTRLQQPHTSGAYMNFQAGSRLEILDPYTVRFIFPEPDGGALVKLSRMHIGNRQFYRELGWGEKSW
jgi:ABC-type transport system substrate-binding protein